MKSVLMLLSLLFVSSTLISCAAPKTTSDSGGMTPTIYYKPTIHLGKTKCTTSHLREILSPEGVTLATLCDSDYRTCLMQGSCFVEDEGVLTSYNYHSTKEGVARFIITDLKKCPYGYGVNSVCLDPYFSVAADLKIHKVGDVIYVPRLVGVEMPNGEVHDGFLVIRDAGGSINGSHRFDFFTGFLNHKDKKNPMARLGFGDPRSRIHYRLATESEAAAARTRRGYPGLRKDVLAEGQIVDGVSENVSVSN